jgi:hypothetical protein
MKVSPTATPIESLKVETGLVEIVPSRQPEGHGFFFKVRSTGCLYRLDSARDPHMPRFWCFRIFRCAPVGTVDSSERPWFGGDRMTREDIPAALALIKQAPDTWLALPQHVDLRVWLLESHPPVPLHSTLAPTTARRLQTR